MPGFLLPLPRVTAGSAQTRSVLGFLLRGLVPLPLSFKVKLLFVPIFTSGPKLHAALPGTPEKNAKADPRVDTGFRGRSPSNSKAALQSPKPSPAARPALPQKPRAALRPGKGPAGPWAAGERGLGSCGRESPGGEPARGGGASVSR